MITQRPKGTQDWYGVDMQQRTLIEEKARRLCKAYNIKEIITPVLEHTVLFSRGVGAEAGGDGGGDQGVLRKRDALAAAAGQTILFYAGVPL